MEIPDGTRQLNLNGCFPAPAIMARIATELELHGSIYITGATCAGEGPGLGAYLMGQSAEKAAQQRDPSRNERPLDDRGSKAIQEPQAKIQSSSPTGDEGPRRDAY